MGMAREMMSVSELLAMWINRIVLILSLIFFANLVTGQDEVGQDAIERDENTASSQTGDTISERKIPTQFTPKETISPDSIVSFPADI